MNNDKKKKKKRGKKKHLQHFIPKISSKPATTHLLLDILYLSSGTTINVYLLCISQL